MTYGMFFEDKNPSIFLTTVLFGLEKYLLRVSSKQFAEQVQKDIPVMAALQLPQL